MSLKGRQSYGKLENNVDSLRENYLFTTVSKTGSGKVALDTVAKKFAQVVTGEVVESGSTNNILKKTAHGLKEGYMIRIASTANGILEEEINVDTVIDANNVRLSAFLSASLAAGDTYDVYKPVSERVAADGSALATVVSPPIQIIKNGVVQTVEDSATPADVVAIPVKMVAADGTNITIYAGAIDVQNSAEGVNFDSIRIGDGTAKYAGITADLELQTHDQGVIDAVEALVGGGLATEAKQDDQITLATALNAKDFATAAKQDSAQTRLNLLGTEVKQDSQITLATSTNTKLDTLIAKDFSTAAKQDSQITLATSADTKLDTIIAKDFATATKQDAEAVLLGAINETAPVGDTNSSGLNGRLQRIAQRITSLIALFPVALGQGTKAQGFRVVLPSDQTVDVQQVTNTVGSQTKTTITSGNTATPTVPANATGFILKNAGDSAGDLCWEIGGAANGSSFDLTAGQGTAFVPCNAALSLFAKNGDVNYALQWLIK